MAEAADDVHVVAEGFERLEDRGELEAGAGRGWRPFVIDRAVRDVDESESRQWLRGGLREQRAGGNHRVEQRQGEGGAHATQEGATGQALLGYEHQILNETRPGQYFAPSSSGTARFSRCLLYTSDAADE